MVRHGDETERPYKLVRQNGETHVRDTTVRSETRRDSAVRHKDDKRSQHENAEHMELFSLQNLVYTAWLSAVPQQTTRTTLCSQYGECNRVPQGATYSRELGTPGSYVLQGARYSSVAGASELGASQCCSHLSRSLGTACGRRSCQ